MCQIDQRESTVSFAEIRLVLRELFAKKHGGGPFDPPLTSAWVRLGGGDLIIFYFLDQMML